MKTKCYDQNQLPVIRDQLLLHSRSLTAALEAFTGQRISEPTLSQSMRPEQLMEDITLLESNVELLRREISAGRNPQAAAPVAPAPASTAAAPAQAQIAAKKLSPDEKLWALHGVKSAEQLNAKIDRERALGLHKDIGD